MHPDRACALIRERAKAAMAAAAGAEPPPLDPGVLEVSVRTSDIAEAAAWVRGVDQIGPRQLRIHGPDRLATYRAFCAAILLTRSVAEAV
jgi:D-amino peptidase